MKRTVNNNSSIDSLREIHFNYLDVAYQSCKDFQERIRRNGVKNFNIWIFLEQQFKKHHISNNLNRKPPKAVTIEQWFSHNHLSGSKMGTEDLKMICKFINNSDPIVAFYEETIKEFFPQSTEIIENTAALNSLVFKLGELQGNLFGEFSDAVPDGITSEEAARITEAAEAIEQQCKKIVSKLQLKKVS